MNELSHASAELIEASARGLALSDALLEWYDRQNRALPWREKFKSSGDPYVVWVSEIMLQQTTIQAVLPAYDRFMRQFPNLASLAAAEETEVRLACRGLGYYRRFRLLHQAAQILAARQPFKWPKDFDEWLELPGIGQYTAAAMSSICFDVPKAVVDGNVERVFARLLDLRVSIEPRLKRHFQGLADRLVPQVRPGDFNQAIMELGQVVCTKQNPSCQLCPIAASCRSLRAESQHLAPAPRKTLVWEDVAFHIWLIVRRGKVALVQRSAQAKFLGGTLGFPAAWELDDGSYKWQQSGLDLLTPNRIGQFRHSITKHRIQVTVHHLVPKPAQKIAATWVALSQVEQELLSNLDRKALHTFQEL